MADYTWLLSDWHTYADGDDFAFFPLKEFKERCGVMNLEGWQIDFDNWGEQQNPKFSIMSCPPLAGVSRVMVRRIQRG
jgi:hypothetical protein